MKVIKPVVFSSSQLLSTTAVETESTYDAGTTYAIGNKVVYLTRIYESLVNSNTGNSPDTSPTKWLDIAPANKYAMFDNSVSTKTVGTTPLVVEIKPGTIVNSIAILNIDKGITLTVEMKDTPSGSVVYTKTIDLDDTIILDWYMYFFEPYDLRDTIVLTDLPPYSTCVIKLTLTSLAGNVEVGAVVYGTVTDIGLTQYGVNFGIRDYSVKDTDDYGNTVFVKRAFSRRMEPTVFIENTKLRYISKVLGDIRSTPTVWIGSAEGNYEPLVIYGYYKDYNIDVSYPTSSLLRLDIEGLT